MKPLTKMQLAALRLSRRWPLRDGSIEQSIQLGIQGAALEKVISSLERRGLVGGECATITDAGLDVLSSLLPSSNGDK
jgi:hypothetical protein